MKRWIVALTAACMLAFAASASAQTLQLGHNCSVSANNPTRAGGNVSYSAGNSCAGSDGRVSKQMTVCLQVLYGGVSWVTIPGSCNTESTANNPLTWTSLSYEHTGAGYWRTYVASVADSGSGWNVSGGLLGNSTYLAGG